MLRERSMTLSHRTNQFQTAELAPALARQAYPLIHLANPNVAMPEWLAFVRRWSRLSPDRGGIVALKDRRGYIHAVYTYKIDYSIAIGRLLRVSDVIAGNLPGPALGRFIMDSVNHLADRLNCPSIVLETPARTDTDALANGLSAPFSILHHLDADAALKHH